MIANNSSVISHGLYSFPKASRIIGVESRRLKRWIHVETGIFRSRYQDIKAVSFLDLMELLFVKMFRDEDVSLQTIRKAAEKASRRFDTEYPFAVKKFDTDGRTIFATLIKEESDEEIIEDLRHGQLVFKQIIKPLFKKLEYREQDVMKYWPMFKKGRVVLDPSRNFGEPIDFETGVPTSILNDAVALGQDMRKVASWYGVPLTAVQKAVEFEKSL